jgi:putative transposase
MARHGRGNDQGAAGWEKNGKKPTDRGELGVKRSTLIDGRGVPLAVAVEGANVPDQKLVAATLDGIR